MFEMMNCVKKKKMPVAIFGGPIPGSLPTEFTQAECFSMSIYSYPHIHTHTHTNVVDI